MNDTTLVVGHWQQLLQSFAADFTQPGFVRFAQWVTGMVLGWEEHTLTQILTSIGFADRWRVAEHFAEYGAFDGPAVERQTRRLIDREATPRFAGYRVVAVDDTKCHRTSADVWGVCTFHEPASRSVNRATTVRAHNWVVAGDLVRGKSWTYLPHSARLYFRQIQLPVGQSFATKTSLAAGLLRDADADSPAPILAVIDGAYARKTVIGPCLDPKNGRRIDVVSRVRLDARLCEPTPPRDPHRRGQPRKWGVRLPSPAEHAKWKTPWHAGTAFVYGRTRQVRYREQACRWAVTGPQEPVRVFAFEVEGYTEPWYLMTTSAALSGFEVVEVFAARFRQEDGFRDHKQRLGMEECRAWTQAPVERTFAVQMVAQTLLWLLGQRLNADPAVGEWWSAPAWNRHKVRASLLDVRRLMWNSREEFSQFLRWLEELRECPQESWNSRKAAA